MRECRACSSSPTGLPSCLYGWRFWLSDLFFFYFVYTHVSVLLLCPCLYVHQYVSLTTRPNPFFDDGTHPPLPALQGAGGNGNVLKEIVDPAGATYDIRKVRHSAAAVSMLLFFVYFFTFFYILFCDQSSPSWKARVEYSPKTGAEIRRYIRVDYVLFFSRLSSV